MDTQETTPAKPEIGSLYSWDEVRKCGGEETFLGKRGNKIVCATLDGNKNPDAPDVMVVGHKAKNRKRAEEFCNQKGLLPIFIKEKTNKWRYCGKYEFQRYTDEPSEIEKYQNEANRDLTRVIFLRPAEGQPPAGRQKELAKMPANRTAALIVCYYLSKFDTTARKNLGYDSWNKAYSEIGEKLQVNPTSIKNMRDEFDPIHQNKRKGWHQRSLRPSRANVVDKFSEMPEAEMLSLVNGILNEKTYEVDEPLVQIVEEIGSGEGKKTRNIGFVNRGTTGRAAEEKFIEKRKELLEIFRGDLTDKRDDGCGYDFEISTQTEKVFVEIKGLDGEIGGVCFSGKEWETAKKLGGKYWLVLVRNVSSKPSFQCIQAPAVRLSAKQAFVQRVQSLFNITDKELKKHAVSYPEHNPN
jgi:hypothetical protein